MADLEHGRTASRTGRRETADGKKKQGLRDEVRVSSDGGRHELKQGSAGWVSMADGGRRTERCREKQRDRTELGLEIGVFKFWIWKFVESCSQRA